MNGRSSFWRCTLARVLLLGLAVALAPLPALAGQPGQQPTVKPAVSLADSVQKAALAERLTPTPPARGQSSAGGGEDTGSWSFFKSKTGMAILAVFVAGTGYALYSTQHDRITSPEKK